MLYARPEDRVELSEDTGARAATVRVLPSGVEFVARPGETVLEAAETQGYIWPTICHGNAECTRCFFEVVEGAENLSPMEPREQEALDAIRWRGVPRPAERLGCCAEVNGDVVVRRRSVRKREEGTDQ